MFGTKITLLHIYLSIYLSIYLDEHLDLHVVLGVSVSDVLVCVCAKGEVPFGCVAHFDAGYLRSLEYILK